MPVSSSCAPQNEFSEARLNRSAKGRSRELIATRYMKQTLMATTEVTRTKAHPENIIIPTFQKGPLGKPLNFKHTRLRRQKMKDARVGTRQSRHMNDRQQPQENIDYTQRQKHPLHKNACQSHYSSPTHRNRTTRATLRRSPFGASGAEFFCLVICPRDRSVNLMNFNTTIKSTSRI